MPSPVVHIVGARPNFMKAAPVIGALKATRVEQVIVHTGQHYDAAMSDVFFRDLGLPEPDLNLGVGSGSHASQTAAIMVGLEAAFARYRPGLVVVYGDVNSTVAAALVASKIGLPIAHVEAGLRSFDDSMPEEVNRRVTDLLSDLLFVTSPEGMTNLGRMGVDPARVHFVGNPMIDTLIRHLPLLQPDVIAERLGIAPPYAVATMHRPANVDDPVSRTAIATMLQAVAERLTVVVPLHPRGKAALEGAGLVTGGGLRVIEPLGYLEFLSLVRAAAVVITDSGGIQEETTILGIPCLTVRPNTERPITITHGTNRLVQPDAVAGWVDQVLDGTTGAPPEPPPLWDGRAGERIASVIARWLGEATQGAAGA